MTFTYRTRQTVHPRSRTVDIFGKTTSMCAEMSIESVVQTTSASTRAATQSAQSEQRWSQCAHRPDLLQRTSRVGFCPISTRSQAGVTRSDDPRQSTRSLRCACSPAVVSTMCSSPSPKLMIVFIRYPSQSCGQEDQSLTGEPQA